jgi:FKBP-type peptidyl-prolyl cis-trans isomerase SlpA
VSDHQEILPGSPVILHLSIRLEDGTEAVSTFGEEPVALTMGDGTLQPGLELALYGLRPGATQTLKLLPGQAYGPRDPDLIQFMPMTEFDGTFTPETGQIVAFAMPDGDEVPGMIRSVDGGRIEVDFNHPLAGHEITFEVEILGVSAPPTGSDRHS